MDPFSDIARRGFDEYGQFINPLIAGRAALTGEPVRVVHTDDGRLVTEDGRLIEDFHGTQAFGHRHPAITAAAQAFLATDAPNWYPSRVNPYSARFARRLCERTNYTTVYFGGSGADAVEASLKLARATTRRPRLLGLQGAYHGCGLGGTALMESGPFHDPFGPHLPGVSSLPFGDIAALEHALSIGDVAGVIVEPIQGEGGIRRLPSDYVAALCELTERHGALLIADEIQTGFGRSGVMLQSSSWPRRPEVALLAKQIAGGLMPLSAMLTTREVFLKAYGRDLEDGESHNATFSYNALAAVTGLAAIDLLDEALLARIREAGDRLRSGLTAALTGLPLFHQVRGDGLMVGLELVPVDHPWLSLEHFGMEGLAAKGRTSIAPLLCLRLYRRGYHCFPCGHDWKIVRIQPRFFISDEGLDDFVTACREELSGLCDLL